MRTADIAIVGLGVHGSAAACAFARHGWRVVGIDPAAPGEVRGASQGPVRMVRVADPERPGLAATAAAALESWQALTADQREPLLRRVTGVFATPHPGDGDRRGAIGEPMPGGVAVPPGWTVTREDGCGLLDARATVLALRAQARALGADLRFGQPARLGPQPPPPGGPVRLHAGAEPVLADRLLICVGAWSTTLPDWAGIPGLRREPAHLQVAAVPHPPVGAFYVFGAGPDRFCVVPLAGGDAVQFGHFSPPPGSAGADAQAGRVRRLDLAALRRYMPGAGDPRGVRTVTAAYTLPPGGGFVLRRTTARTATLAACSGIGFKFAPVLAEQVRWVLAGDGAPATGPLRVEEP